MTKERQREEDFHVWDRSTDNPYYYDDIEQGAYDNADEVQTAFYAGYDVARKRYSLTESDAT